MKKQLLKGFTMVMLIVAVAFVAAVASANGQSRNTKANVPFDFIVGSQSLAAGEYTVASMNSQGEVLGIRSVGNKGSAMRLTTRMSGTSEHAKLIFHRYGDRYFLAEVWNGESGRELIKSKQERAAQRELASTGSKNNSTQARYERVEIVATVQ